MTSRLRDLESEGWRGVVNASDTCYRVRSLRRAEQEEVKLEETDYLFFLFPSHCMLFLFDILVLTGLSFKVSKERKWKLETKCYR